MLLRFSLYGFLKNQRYYEPFLVLAFLEKGLSFFTIGVLIGFRELCMNLFEVPSGAAADLYGRRRAMIASFSAYIVSFLVFAWSSELWMLFVAMMLFAVGEAFRTGTHKAMIFDWLEAEGRGSEKARVYGFTRSWSQIGSAVSVLIAAGIVLLEGRYSRVFLYTTVPYLLGLVNFFAYPAYLDGRTEARVSAAAVARHLAAALGQCLHRPALRRLLGESMLQRGTWVTVKDYLQPVLQQAALALPLLLALDAKSRSAVLVGAVYCALFLLSALASRRAHRLRDLAGGAAPATRAVWVATWLVYLALVPALWARWSGAVIAGFVVLAMLQNAWKPVFLERVDDASDAAMGATLLSIDSQTKSLFVIVAAPAVGLAVDHLGLWPVGAAGWLAATLALGLTRPAGAEGRQIG